MTKKKTDKGETIPSEYLAAIGRRGGAVKSKQKAKAAAANGMLGGRPTIESKIVEQVRTFFGSRKYVYTKPGANRRTMNFYGDRAVCRLWLGDVVALILAARKCWTWTEDEDKTQGAIDQVLGDLQFERPE